MDYTQLTMAMTGLLTLIIGMATAYLRLFVSNQMSALKEELGVKYLSKELDDQLDSAERERVNAELEALNHRVSRLEGRKS